MGRVVRHQIPSCDHLRTIDEVFVYLYDMVPYGQEMPLVSHEYVISMWDESTGLPLLQVIASPLVAECLWLRKAHQSNFSSLFCEPDAANPSSFMYTVDNERNRRDRVSVGYFNPQFRSWSQFCPPNAFHTQPVDD